jgi:hypothetical protein
MKAIKITVTALFVCMISSITAQVISQLGVWNNNANFSIEYYQNILITSTTSGIKFIDVSDPSNPLPTLTLPTPGGFPMAIAIDNNYAFFGGGMSPYFMIVDISNINLPVQTGITNNVSGTTSGIAVKGNFAFMPTSTDTLYSINISNKTAPFVLNKIDLGSVPHGIAIKGNYAYVTTNGGLKVLDISNPANLSVTATFNGNYQSRGLDADTLNNRLFINNGTGFDVIDISNQTNPVLLFQGLGGSFTGSLSYKNGYVFQCGNEINAFQINSLSATNITSFPIEAMWVSSKDSVFYVSNINNVNVLKLGQSVPTGINYEIKKDLVIYPNPANNFITIRNENNSQKSEITIYNNSGQKIKEIRSTDNIQNIDISDLTIGLYNIYINTGNEVIIKEFIKKQKD